MLKQLTIDLELELHEAADCEAVFTNLTRKRKKQIKNVVVKILFYHKEKEAAWITLTLARRS